MKPAKCLKEQRPRGSSLVQQIVVAFADLFREARHYRLTADVTEPPWKRFVFPWPVLDEIRSLRDPGNFRGVFEVAKDPAICIVAAWMSLLAWRHFPLALSVPTYLGAVVLIGARQRGIADSLHMGTHHALARNALLNFTLATVASGYLVFQGYWVYFVSHVLHHHPRLGDPVLDPDYAALRRQGLYGSTRGAATARRYLRNILSVRNSAEYAAMLVRDRILGALSLRIVRLELCLRLTYWATLAVIISEWRAWPLVLAYWIVPLLTTANWLGQLIELLEHYPLMETRPRVDLYMTRNRLLGAIGRCLLGTHHENYHLVHHLFEWLPPWRVQPAHAVLMQVAEYAQLHRERGLPATLRAMFEEAEAPPAVPAHRRVKRATIVHVVGGDEASCASQSTHGAVHS